MNRQQMHSLRIPALFMRGGTSKGVFFRAEDLPEDPASRDALLLRVVGSPDPYGTQMDGMGGGTSSTSKVVVIAKSQRPEHDVDYRFGAVAIGAPVIDWSGNCGNLSAAVGPFAVTRGIVTAPPDGFARIRIWQANVGRTIIATFPMDSGHFCESGDFMLDGVAFASSEIRLEFMDPAGSDGEGAAGALFPTGRTTDVLNVPGFGSVEATLIDAGNPAAFMSADVLGLTGIELRPEVNGNEALLAKAETLRCYAAVAMGLAPDPETANRTRPATPKLTLFARPRTHRASDGRMIEAGSVDVLARIFSMGRLHHAMTGTGAVAIAAAAAVPGTVVSTLLPPGHRTSDGITFAHPSGTTRVAADADESHGDWRIRRVVLSRSARVLMDGFVHVPR